MSHVASYSLSDATTSGWRYRRHAISRWTAVLVSLVVLIAAGGVQATTASADPGDFTNKTTANTGAGLGSNTVRGVWVIGSTVYAATNGGLSISTDGGTTFTNKTTIDGLGNDIVNGVYVIDGAQDTVYAATYGGLSISTDGGTTFTNKTTSDGLGNNNVLGVYDVGSII